MNPPPNLIAPLALLVSFAVILVLSLSWQRKRLRGQDLALSQQREAIARVEESMALTRRNVALNERSVALAEEAVRNQKEMIQLLRRLGDRVDV